VAPEPARDMLPLVVVAHDDPATADSLRHAVETAAGWRVAVADPDRAGLGAALAAGPAVALVGCAVLAELPPGCRVPLLAVGDDQRAADLRAALAAGARGLVTWPDDAADLAAELARTVGAGARQPAGEAAATVLAVRGVHGGAGTTTVAAHLAGGWARWGPAPVLLADLSGGIGFRLDLGQTRTWSALATAAAALGGADLADALPQPWPGLTVLPLAALVDGAAEPPPEPWVVASVLQAARAAYGVVVVDLPPAGGDATEVALAQADVLLAVGRCETAGVRGLQAVLHAWAAAGRDPEAAGAVVTGVRTRAPLASREVRTALRDDLWALVPASTPELAAAAEDGVLLLDRPDIPAVQAMLALANRVLPFTVSSR
jgi:cellulose biosynthesis protein BcsQ